MKICIMTPIKLNDFDQSRKRIINDYTSNRIYILNTTHQLRIQLVSFLCLIITNNSLDIDNTVNQKKT